MGKIINPFGGNDSAPVVQNESTPPPKEDLKEDLKIESVREKPKSTDLPEGYVDVIVNGQSKRRLKTYHEDREKPLSIKEQWAAKRAKKNGR